MKFFALVFSNQAESIGISDDSVKTELKKTLTVVFHSSISINILKLHSDDKKSANYLVSFTVLTVDQRRLAICEF